MEIGQIFNIGDEEFCICDIKKYGNHTFAYTTTGYDKETKAVFFELIDDENGTKIEEIINEDLIAELLGYFISD